MIRRNGSVWTAAGRRGLVAVFCCLAACAVVAQPLDDAQIVELNAPALRDRLAAGDVSAEQVVRAFLARIAELDDVGPGLRAILEINPDAISIAQELDRRHATSGVTGPLHGVPVVLKANIDTGDRMSTSAGSILLAQHLARSDAELVERLRVSGAVLLAKTNLSEWANFRSIHSTSGWSSHGGQTRNPYVLDRNPCGSSSGSAVAVAARLAPLAVGTETDGSILCPASANGVVGLKPTLGLVSAQGIVPLAASQDAAGPMARTVEGAALLLAAMVGLDSEPLVSSARFDDLRGVRFGVVRDYFGAGEHPLVEEQYAASLAMLAAAGAVLVDPVLIGLDEELRRAELEVLLFEFKAGINEYLAATASGPRSLEELIELNIERAAEIMPHFGQDVFIAAQAKGGLQEPAYERARAASGARLSVQLESLFEAHDLDALVAPSNAPAWKTDWVNGDTFSVSSSSIAAVSGYPSITVPAALVSELPLGITLIAPPRGEAILIAIAAAFERMRGEFPAPRFLPSLED